MNYDDTNNYKQLEFDYYDGEFFHYLTIINVNKNRDELTLAIQYQGMISIKTYDLQENTAGIYFFYGPSETKLYLDDFTIGADCYD